MNKMEGGFLQKDLLKNAKKILDFNYSLLSFVEYIVPCISHIFSFADFICNISSCIYIDYVKIFCYDFISHLYLLIHEIL